MSVSSVYRTRSTTRRSGKNGHRPATAKARPRSTRAAKPKAKIRKTKTAVGDNTRTNDPVLPPLNNNQQPPPVPRANDQLLGQTTQANNTQDQPQPPQQDAEDLLEDIYEIFPDRDQTRAERDKTRTLLHSFGNLFRNVLLTQGVPQETLPTDFEALCHTLLHTNQNGLNSNGASTTRLPEAQAERDTRNSTPPQCLRTPHPSLLRSAQTIPQA
ncbi:hypothetical protein KEM55_004345 [Ascosphaera atra]|nr:hypothetical protein KEM55_004345 [Ascosphaera atra]